MERDLTVRVLSISFDNFNSHAHVERDQSKFYDSKVTYDFNSHAHVERDFTQLLSSIMRDNFNSHAHVERDEKLMQCVSRK